MPSVFISKKRRTANLCNVCFFIFFALCITELSTPNKASAITAAELDAGFQLSVYGGSEYPAYGSLFYTNYAGANEKYLRGSDGWYYILPSGRLALWDGSFNTSKPIANLDPSYYDDPFLLTEAALRQNPQPNAGTLKATYNFYADPAGDFRNYSGWNEKYFHGRDGWYFILPNGTVYLWNSNFEKSEPLAHLTPRYYEDLQLLISGVNEPEPQPVLVASSPEDNQTAAVTPTPFQNPTTTTTTSSVTSTTIVQECSAYSITLDGVCMYSNGGTFRGGDVSTCGSYDSNPSYLKTYYGIHPSTFASCLNDLLTYPNTSTLTDVFLSGGHFYASYLFTRAEMNDFLLSLANNARNPVVIYVDQECNRVPAASATNLCGAATTWTKGYFLSPISLVWRENVGAGESHSLSQFPLDPEQSGMWYAWKASADFPLLVFDPDHRGKVTHASQLFGTSAFGISWKNGYEALATLDKNSDGEISGKELSPLSLWFDENRDGVSQKGEVRSIQSTGVNALYYQADDIQLNSPDVVATKGYKRVVDGSEVFGRSIDWFVMQVPSKSEAVTSEDVRETATNSYDKISFNQLSPLKDRSKSSALSPDGAWSWKIDDDRPFPGKGRPGGVLIFQKNGANLRGISLIETPLNSNPQGLRAAITSFPLLGSVSSRSDGRTEMNFEVIGPQGVETRAFLSQDGKVISGKSRKVFKNTKGKDGKPFALEYSWTATKF